MIHILYCPRLTPLWKACINFTMHTLKAPQPYRNVLAIAFGQWRPANHPEPLGPEDARAFLRHAFQCMYNDYSRVDLADHHFEWQSTFLRTLKSFQDAALRRIHLFKTMRAQRSFTSLPQQPSDDAINKYPNIITVSSDLDYAMNPLITQEITRYENIIQHIRDTHQRNRARTGGTAAHFRNPPLRNNRN